MNKRLLLIPLLTIMAVSTTTVRAEDDKVADARLAVGYKQPPSPGKEPSAGLAWMAMGVLGLIALGSLCMNARRTHLD